MPCEGIEDFRIFIILCCAREKETAGDAKSIPALKINMLWDIAYSIPYLVPQFQLRVQHCFASVCCTLWSVEKRLSSFNFQTAHKHFVDVLSRHTEILY